jgi:hypothetical protein
MTPDEREQTAADLAGILARGYDWHVHAHGPDGSYAVRTADGRRYEITQTAAGGAAGFIERGGERFTVTVAPLAGQAASPAALASWLLSPEGQAAAKAACEFAQRTWLNLTSSEVCAIVVAAHEAEVAARERSRNQPEDREEKTMSRFEPTVPADLVTKLNEAGVIAEDGTLHEDPGKVVITLSPGQAQRFLLYLKRRAAGDSS